MFYNRFNIENLKLGRVNLSVLVNKFKAALVLFTVYTKSYLIIKLDGFLYIAFENLSSNYAGEEHIKCNLKVAN